VLAAIPECIIAQTLLASIDYRSRMCSSIVNSYKLQFRNVL
jgi:hypothetical protein